VYFPRKVLCLGDCDRFLALLRFDRELLHRDGQVFSQL
jgi:hypothetical protein